MRNKINELTNKKWFIPTLLISAFVSGFLISLIGFTLYNLVAKKASPFATPNPFVAATPKAINNNNPDAGIYNHLLLGYGGGTHEGTNLTDSIIVIHVNTNTKRADLISIPRDLEVSGNEKINSVGAISGFQNVGPAITGVTGLPINYYVAINFDEFTKLIDNLGGVKITMPNTLDDAFYPIIGEENNVCGLTDPQIFELKNKYTGFDLEKQFACRYEHLQYQKGQQVNLDGATALKIARSRHGDSDFARSLRQFAILQGISQKLISLKSMNKIDETVSTLFNMVKTDLDLGTIKSLGQLIADPASYKINQIQLTSDNVLQNSTSSNGAFVLSPKNGNFQSIKDYINSQLQ